MDLDKLDFSGSPHLRLETGHEDVFSVPPPYVTEQMQLPSVDVAEAPDTRPDDADDSSPGIMSVRMPSKSATENINIANINIAKKLKKMRFK